MRNIILIAHNVRSCHNVGSLLRTAEGLGVKTVYLTGYTPYPMQSGDKRMPHIAQKVHKQIQKTALDAEKLVNWRQQEDVFGLIKQLRTENYHVVALEQTLNSQKLPEWQVPQDIAVVVGHEVEGIEPEVVAVCNLAVEIPMFGKKESFNVVQAAAMALYHARFS